jgi:hypothetical protein
VLAVGGSHVPEHRSPARLLEHPTPGRSLLLSPRLPQLLAAARKKNGCRSCHVTSNELEVIA